MDQLNSPAGVVPELRSRPTTWRRLAAILLPILIVGGLLRFVGLCYAPPGLHQDEAANAWNVWCLLKTGSDQVGVRWPIFYSRCFGENRNTLFFYWMLPFQAIGGMSIWTTRIPTAVAGVLTLPLMYYLASRLFGRTTGLVAAGLLAITPWHIQQSRWGHEAAIVPFLTALSASVMLWANLPLNDMDQRRFRPGLALLAGAVVGICCYGYFAVRAFLPIFIATAILVNAKAWWTVLKSRAGIAAIAGFFVGLSLTFGPLAYKHLTDPAMSKRLADTRIWAPDDSFTTKATKALARYPGHFGPSFLFLDGDSFESQSPPGSGMFHLYMLPLMLAGLYYVVRRLRVSLAARTLLAWLIVYPIGDCLSYHPGLHALRSLPGLCALVLLGAVGAVEGGRRLAAFRPWTAWTAGTILAIAAFGFNVRFVHRFFGEYNGRVQVYHTFQTDFVEACQWIRPHLNNADAVVCSVDELIMPYMVSLVVLNHDPVEWFKEPREFHTIGQWDYCYRYGKFFFHYDKSTNAYLDGLMNNGKNDRVLFILRPYEAGDLGKPVHIIRRPDGLGILHIYDVTI